MPGPTPPSAKIHGDAISAALANRAKGGKGLLIVVGVFSMLLAGLCTVTAEKAASWLKDNHPKIAQKISGFGVADDGIKDGLKTMGATLLALGTGCFGQLYRKFTEESPIEAGVVALREVPKVEQSTLAKEKAEQTEAELRSLLQQWTEYGDKIAKRNTELTDELNKCEAERTELFGKMLWSRLFVRCIWMMPVFALAYMAAVWVFRSYHKGIPMEGELLAGYLAAAFSFVGGLAGIYLQSSNCRIVRTTHQVATIGLAAFIPCICFFFMSLGKGNLFHTEVFAPANGIPWTGANWFPADLPNGFAVYKSKAPEEVYKVFAFLFAGCAAAAAAAGAIGISLANLVVTDPRKASSGAD